MKLIFSILSVLLFSLAQVGSQSSGPKIAGRYWEHPWYADYNGVVNIISEGYTTSCTGVLIHSQWVLTSAVCGLKTFKNEMRILFGGNSYDFDTAAHIKNTNIHPQFDAEDREHDIALLQLARPANSTIRVFKIPKVKRSLVAKRARVVRWSWYNPGWNVDATTEQDPINNTEGPRSDNNYYYANSVVIIDNDLCERYPVQVSDERLCSYGSIACQGDEGAPLITCEDNELVGLVSVSDVQAAICDNNNCMMPVTTYTAVGPYACWLREVTELNIL